MENSMLPKIEQPLFKMTVPSTKKDIMVRPMLVKEEKILLMAKDTDNYGNKLLAIKQVVNNCCQNINIDELTIFDMEYLFLKIRAISVDSKVKVTFTDMDDEKEREFEIDLEKITVDFSDAKDNKIEIGKDSGLVLRYPTSKLYETAKQIKSEEDFMNALVVNAMQSYYSGDTVFDFTKETQENMEKFIDENITSAVYYKIREFLASVPTLKHEIKYENESGEEKTITLSSLNDFFTF